MVVLDKFVFVHIPKTGGNSFQSQIFDPSFHRKLVRGNQDGKDRFEVSDKYTFHKHQVLAEYLEHPDLTKYEFVSIVRNPVDRLLSFYFSPHRHMKPKTRVEAALMKLNMLLPKSLRRPQKNFLHYVTPEFDQSDFLEVLRTTPSQTAFLSAEGKIYDNLTVIRFENYQTEVTEFLNRHGFEYQPSNLNRSGYKNDRWKLLTSEIVAEIKSGHHAADFHSFGYDMAELAKYEVSAAK